MRVNKCLANTEEYADSAGSAELVMICEIVIFRFLGGIQQSGKLQRKYFDPLADGAASNGVGFMQCSQTLFTATTKMHFRRSTQSASCKHSYVT